MKIITIIGARPQFIKSAAVSRAIKQHNALSSHSDTLEEAIVHTGQHYDQKMSDIFFKELEIPEPAINLNIGSGSHGFQTGQMLIRIEALLLSEKPDIVLVYGDTNSTLAGALAAVKLHLPIAHVESGLRSFNKRMPEEHNRIVTDHISTLLFCPTKTSIENLTREGISEGVHLVGDVMFDSVLYNFELAQKKSAILDRLSLIPKTYALATIHRAENTDHAERLKKIIQAFEDTAKSKIQIVIPMHPRTRKRIAELNIDVKYSMIIEPVSYLDMLLLEKHASFIFTDSGGVQKEAYWAKVPCITLRDETEWVETVASGWNFLAGADYGSIIASLENRTVAKQSTSLYGNGNASQLIIRELLRMNGKAAL
ncbi:MAG: UDP-N-acetylglucosamine 2-epimerase (non-hydrolyzing) [Desulfobacteraceae bacterium]|nr:MAG: UDP-N-acetylglucosamine 2-epimerase (non-hydrolyzing) [Desulfobacteraceae bacterium]